MTKKIPLFVLAFCLFILSASAQDQTLRKRDSTTPTPGGIKLLSGYVHTPGRGIDSTVGSIKKEGRLDIKYDIGILAGEYVDRCRRDNTCVWYKEQQLDAGLVKVALRSDRIIVATFPRTMANFYAKVETEEDIADFLLMILTFDETQCCQNAY
ncbi:MAG TPA: hypothetical protein VF571_13980 [Pyrinomonadaceae bacterium]|jgi:hypothetical protein